MQCIRCGTTAADGSRFCAKCGGQLSDPGAATARISAAGTAVDPLPVRSAVGDEPVDLAALGEEAVLVFWNPGCGHCRAMEPALRAWAADPPAGAARLVLVSSGAASEGLESLTVLDPQFAAGRYFGATGTPMAVRVDAEGRVASGLATGGDAALALARSGFALKLVTR